MYILNHEEIKLISVILIALLLSCCITYIFYFLWKSKYLRNLSEPLLGRLLKLSYTFCLIFVALMNYYLGGFGVSNQNRSIAGDMLFLIMGIFFFSIIMRYIIRSISNILDAYYRSDEYLNIRNKRLQKIQNEFKTYTSDFDFEKKLIEIEVRRIKIGAIITGVFLFIFFFLHFAVLAFSNFI